MCGLAVKPSRLGREPVLLTAATRARRQLGGYKRERRGGGVVSEPRPSS